MFDWLFVSPPALSVPAKTQSLEWDLVANDAPPAPANTLVHELDPIQELFVCDLSYEREVAWYRYMTALNSYVCAHV